MNADVINHKNLITLFTSTKGGDYYFITRRAEVQRLPMGWTTEKSEFKSR
jgi:hypothetical protein